MNTRKPSFQSVYHQHIYRGWLCWHHAWTRVHGHIDIAHFQMVTDNTIHASFINRHRNFTKSTKSSFFSLIIRQLPSFSLQQTHWYHTQIMSFKWQKQMDCLKRVCLKNKLSNGGDTHLIHQQNLIILFTDFQCLLQYPPMMLLNNATRGKSLYK